MSKEKHVNQILSCMPHSIFKNASIARPFRSKVNAKQRAGGEIYALCRKFIAIRKLHVLFMSPNEITRCKTRTCINFENFGPNKLTFDTNRTLAHLKVATSNWCSQKKIMFSVYWALYTANSCNQYKNYSACGSKYKLLPKLRSLIGTSWTKAVFRPEKINTGGSSLPVIAHVWQFVLDPGGRDPPDPRRPVA